MSTFRRNIINNYNSNYITDGLVFHLDGINKGSVEGAWTDLVGNVQFENHGAVPLHNGWLFTNDSQYNISSFLLHNKPLNYPSDTHTIEVVFKQNDKRPAVLFCSEALYSIAAIITSVGKYTNKVSNAKSLPAFTIGLDDTNPHCISMANNKSVVDIFNSVAESITWQWYGALNATSVGGRARDGFPPYGFGGIIYSIRIYNRLLSEKEMQHNQKVDYKRFDLDNAGNYDWFNDAIVCWYDPKLQGCTNENMAENPILKDLSGNGNDMECKNFEWNTESGINDNCLVFDGVDDCCECIGRFKLTDFTQIANRNVDKFIEQVDSETNSMMYRTLFGKSASGSGAITRAFIAEQLNPSYSIGSGGRIMIDAFCGGVTFIPKSKVKNGTNIFTPSKYYYIDSPSDYIAVSRGNRNDSENNPLRFAAASENAVNINAVAAFSLKQYLLFNRTLTDDEIEWVRRNIIREDNK